MSSSPHGTVWYISKYFRTPTSSGPGGRGYYLLRELSRMGYACSAITSDSNHLNPVPSFDGPRYTESIDGVNIEWIQTLKYQGAQSLRRILSWIDFDLKTLKLSRKIRPRPDVIIASSLSLTTILTGLVLKKRYKARLIFEVRDIWPLTITEEGSFSRLNPFVIGLSYIERLGYYFSDAIVGTMPNLEAHVREVSRSNTPVYCIPMGFVGSDIEAQHSGPLPQSYLAARIPEGKFIVGYAGTIGTTNALEVLFEAAEALSDCNDIHFVIVGSGDKLQEFTRHYSTLPNVTFVGQVPKHSVQVVLKTFDVLYLSTFPSRVWNYGLSLNKLIDYMIAGKPVIASYSGFPSMLDEAKCGVFVPAGDSQALAAEFVRFSNLPTKEIMAMGQRGKDWLTANRRYEQLAKDYENILFTGEQAS